MKNSIARKVTKRVSLVLGIAFAILFIVAFLIVQISAFSSIKKYSDTMASVYADVVLDALTEENKPLNTETAESILRFGQYLCQWYNVDYVYIYVPNLENNTRTFMCVVQSEDSDNEKIDGNMIGYVEKYELSDEELDLWNGKIQYAHNTNNNQYGNEFRTLYAENDLFGNRFIFGVDSSYQDLVNQILMLFSIIGGILLLVIVGIYVVVYMIIKSKVSKPAKIVSEAMQEFITDGKRAAIRLDESGDDEYAMMSSAFNSMADDIDKYVKDLNTMYRETEHQKTELEIAAGIQRGFLPKESFSTEFYDIKATMIPAKNVGGDFYMYTPLDENRIFVAIADVSGKGISAAMLMAFALAFLAQFTKMNMSLDKVLEVANNSLYQGNKLMNFLTAFVGIYDKRTQTLTYANAGHNPTYIIGDEIKMLDGAKGGLLGLYPNEKYTSETVKLNVGDTLFMYTDGVNEAINDKKEFYGMKRLESELLNIRNNFIENPVSYMVESVRKFANGAERFDDVTILSLKVKKTFTDIMLDVDVNELLKIKDEILKLPIPRNEQLSLVLAAEECFVNICSYAFSKDKAKNEKVRFKIVLSDRIEMTFEDGGKPYDPIKNLKVPDDYDIDTQIGGLGNFVAFSSVDDVRYEYKNRKNIMTFIKKISRNDINTEVE